MGTIVNAEKVYREFISKEISAENFHKVFRQEMEGSSYKSLLAFIIEKSTASRFDYNEFFMLTKEYWVDFTVEDWRDCLDMDNDKEMLFLRYGFNGAFVFLYRYLGVEIQPRTFTMNPIDEDGLVKAYLSHGPFQKEFMQEKGFTVEFAQAVREKLISQGAKLAKIGMAKGLRFGSNGDWIGVNWDGDKWVEDVK